MCVWVCVRVCVCVHANISLHFPSNAQRSKEEKKACYKRNAHKYIFFQRCFRKVSNRGLLATLLTKGCRLTVFTVLFRDSASKGIHISLLGQHFPLSSWGQGLPSSGSFRRTTVASLSVLRRHHPRREK